MDLIGAQEGGRPRGQLAARAADNLVTQQEGSSTRLPHDGEQTWAASGSPKPQREHVAGATEDDGFPPSVVEGFLSEDEMPRCDVVPGPG